LPAVNILHISSGRGPTGAAAAAVTDVKALLAAGHRAFVAAQRGSGLAQSCDKEGVPCIAGMKAGRGAARLLHLPHDVGWLRGVIREHNINVIHVHRSDDQLLAAAALGRKLAAVLVRTWHRDPTVVPRMLLTRLARQVDGCVCVARAHAETLRGVGASHSVFIHPAVDTELFCPAGAPAGTVPMRIVHVGRWKRDRKGRDRGQRAALDVFAKLRADLPWQGFLVGRGEQAGELREAAYGERGLSEQQVQLINFAEHSPRGFSELLTTFQLGLVFTPGRDGTSRAAVELLACGVPIIVADRPGLAELAEDAACALRQPPDDPAGWARGIGELLSAPQRLAALRVAARCRAEQVHALPVRGRTLAEFYEGL
jgi:glycosyltransferase involved in cell wall biosynthesis